MRISTVELFKIAEALKCMQLDGKTYADIAGTLTKTIGFNVNSQNVKRASEIAGIKWSIPVNEHNPLALLNHKIKELERCLRLLYERLGVDYPN